jgi:hypothetical protein
VLGGVVHFLAEELDGHLARGGATRTSGSRRRHATRFRSKRGGPNVAHSGAMIRLD